MDCDNYGGADTWEDVSQEIELHLQGCDNENPNKWVLYDSAYQDGFSYCTLLAKDVETLLMLFKEEIHSLGVRGFLAQSSSDLFLVVKWYPNGEVAVRYRGVEHVYNPQDMGN